jgi:hypothetical protein
MRLSSCALCRSGPPGCAHQPQNNVADVEAYHIRPLSAVLPDLVFSGLLVIGELLHVAAAGPEAAQVCPTVHIGRARNVCVHVMMCL